MPAAWWGLRDAQGPNPCWFDGGFRLFCESRGWYFSEATDLLMSLVVE
jgi:hypothetical protein